jgi:hypothetical protein
MEGIQAFWRKLNSQSVLETSTKYAKTLDWNDATKFGEPIIYNHLYTLTIPLSISSAVSSLTLLATRFDLS